MRQLQTEWSHPWLSSFNRASFIAARGLDIEQLPRVVNYEMPNVPEDYVCTALTALHTPANEGGAVSLVCVDEHKLLRDIERLLKREIPKVVHKGYEPDPAIRAEPIQNGRNGKARSQQPVKKGKSRSVNRSSANRSVDTRHQSSDSRAKPQHRSPRSDRSRATYGNRESIPGIAG